MSPSTDITTLAADIRREHQAAERAFASAVEHAIRCGALLAEAKLQLPHGAWLPWLDENFPASRRTAQGYMRLANAEHAQALAHLGIEGALRQLAAPRAEPKPEDLEQALANASTVEECAAIARVAGEMQTRASERRRDAERQLDATLPALRRDLKRLHDRGGHTALGYQSWSEFVDAEFVMPNDWDAEFAATMRSLLLEPVENGRNS